ARPARAFRQVAQSGPQGRHRQRQVDEEDGAPGSVFDQPAAEEGTNGGGDAGQAGPGADGGALVLRADAGAQNGEASRNQYGGAHALDGAGQYQAEGARDAPAGGGCQGEPRHAGDERAPLAEDISEAAPNQQE